MAAVYFYSAVLDAVRVLVFPLIKKIGDDRKWDLDRRQKLPSPLREFRGKTVVWLHAASLGEAKLLLKFVSMLQQRRSDERYVVTATTRNGVDYLEKHRHSAFCAIGFQPIDTLSLVGRVLDHYGVKRVWLLETELWPALLYSCRKRSIPVGIVNGRIELSSFAWYKRLQWLISPLLETVSPVFAQTDEYAVRFRSLGISPDALHSVGNLKAHIRIARPDRQEWITLRRAMNIDENTFVVTAGCMHRGEGAVLKTFAAQMAQMGYPCKLIVVPRHLNEASDLAMELGNKCVHIDSITTSRTWEVCVIEKIGILDAMYSVADAAVVGGTFVDIGGHNVWDAACFAIPVFFGPYFDKQKESGDMLREAGVGFSTGDGNELADTMYTVVKGDPMKFLAAQGAFIEMTNKTRSVVEPLLP